MSGPFGEAYTVSRMLDSINETMGDGAKVELKRNVGNGVALDTSAKEIACLDTQAKIKTSVERVANMDSLEKQAWIAHQRSKGNDLFKAQKFKEASDAYLEALTGLDLGGPGHIDVQRNVQHPITCNIVACMLKLEQWDKAVKMASIVLTAEPTNVKSLVQRARAYMHLEDFDKARKDAIAAQDLAHDVSKLLETIRRTQLHARRQQQVKTSFEKNMMKHIGSIYHDKKPPPNPSNMTLSKPSPTLRLWRQVVQNVFKCLAWALNLCFGKRKLA
ncbi:hypothetical protein H257_04393 [Aphanomyces astaci]|uniref:Peptidylprolyl isomerase n=1 Tax=Aphanomyces astaci TaxID=112090 RepID=W4GXM2_APHAT|nr:hypothetical protein H257_04393 [Aphanomyces astaci]ETV83764.1 hypothetical protein H257_04393 [Aphanomyces astaci]|eukprot:XP_009827194.1 hypothetical protein H257_04393 [Aphanomyces astaci]